MPRSVIRLFIAIALIGWGQFVFAGGYIWVVSYGGVFQGDSPAQTCAAYFDFNVAYSPDWILQNRRIERLSDVRFLCVADSKHKHSSAFYERNILATAYRSGDSCDDPDAIYNPETGQCEPPVPDKCSNTVRQVGGAAQEKYEVTACVALEQKGPPESCPSSFDGNPINFAIGNKFQNEIDYLVVGSSVLKFSRSYNSLDGFWRHSYSTHLRIAEDGQSIALVVGHGRESFFTVSGNTVSSSSADIGVLSKTATGWQFLSGDNERFTFNSAGKLTSWSDASGNRQDLVYTGSQVSVTDRLGKSLTFTQDYKLQPLTLTAAGVQITYGYNANNRLTAVNKTHGGQSTQRQFHYEDTRNDALLTGITDERGVRYATWSYDDKGRAISSEHANGAERIAIEYKSDGGASVSNELGKVASYEFQTILGVKRITAIEGEPSANCLSSNSTFTYDSRGLLKTKTDNKGNLTTYDYNTRGLGKL